MSTQVLLGRVLSFLELRSFVSISVYWSYFVSVLSNADQISGSRLD